MNLFTRQSAAFALGGIVAGAVLGVANSAWALTQEEVVQQLRAVPVFTITDEDRAPLVAEPQEGEPGAPLVRVFITQADAAAFLGSLQESNPDLASEVRVTPVSLGRIYAAAVEGQDPENRLEFVFVPSRDEAASAVEILQSELEENGEDPSTVSEFLGVPLFTARSATGSDEEGLLTVPDGEDNQIVPLFFSYDQLQALIAAIGERQPEFAEGLDPFIIRLEELIQTLETTEDEELLQLRLVPSLEALEAAQEAQSEGESSQENDESEAAQP